MEKFFMLLSVNIGYSRDSYINIYRGKIRLDFMVTSYLGYDCINMGNHFSRILEKKNR